MFKVIRINTIKIEVPPFRSKYQKVLKLRFLPAVGMTGAFSMGDEGRPAPPASPHPLSTLQGVIPTAGRNLSLVPKGGTCHWYRRVEPVIGIEGRNLSVVPQGGTCHWYRREEPVIPTAGRNLS